VRSRTLAALAILTVAASGSGLPMCVSLLARAAEPCPMHQHGDGSQATQIVAEHTMGDACHSDGDVGCATGGSCPTGGNATAIASEPVLATSGATVGVTPLIERAHLTFLSPPLPPPPQA